MPQILSYANRCIYTLVSEIDIVHIIIVALCDKSKGTHRSHLRIYGSLPVRRHRSKETHPLVLRTQTEVQVPKHILREEKLETLVHVAIIVGEQAVRIQIRLSSAHIVR